MGSFFVQDLIYLVDFRLCLQGNSNFLKMGSFGNILFWECTPGPFSRAYDLARLSATAIEHEALAMMAESCGLERNWAWFPF
jgi:hypothetical protein